MPDREPQPALHSRPNVLVRGVAHLAVSVRLKLLAAFLGVTLLMVGLAMLGLETLRQANARTEKLLHDQERIAFFQEIYGYLGDLTTIVAAISLDPENVSERTTNNTFLLPGVLIVDRTNNLRTDLGRSTRRFGKEGMPDAQIIAQFKSEIAKLPPIVSRAHDLRREGDFENAGIVARLEAAPILFRLQRDAYSKVQDIEAEMAETARSTALAYDASRQLVVAAALVAVGLSLLLGYAISSSLIWPVRRIGQTLGIIAGGNFAARVTVPNRDELGDLAANVNVTSVKLGTLYDQVEEQRVELAAWNTALEDKVAVQVDEIERTNRLRRFLPDQVADMIVSAGDDADMLGSRRGTVTVLFADLRGFTAFSASVEPEHVISALNRFHAMTGPLIEARGGTLERFLGDGLVVLFNAPVASDDPAGNAVALGREMQAAFPPAMRDFQSDSHALGLGVGIATGQATLGQIGFEGRLDYAAIGTAPNLAARLCDIASDGEILICPTTAGQLDGTFRPVGPFELKGIPEPVPAFAVD